MYTKVFPLYISHTMSMNDAYILVLDAPEAGKQVPVLIGESEAQAIVMALEHKTARRPLTHDLLNNIMGEYMLTLSRVTIDHFEEGIFFSTLYINDGFSEKRIDSRTSDAVVLAIMQQCDITISSQVLEETSMEPGALEGNLPQNKRAKHTDAGDAFDGEIISACPSKEDRLHELEEQLKQCEAEEDYEQAAHILEQIKKLQNEQG